MRFYLTTLVFCCMVIATSVPIYSADVYFDITSQASKRIDIALPYINMADKTDETLVSEIHDTFSKDLSFSGRFNVIDISRFFPTDNREITSPDFQAWYLVGIQSLLTGFLKREEDGDMIELNLRLYDSQMGQQIVGKKYKAPFSELRTIIHKFADEAQYNLTGEKGINFSKIAFTLSAGDKSEVYTIDPDGRNLTQVTHNGAINLSPAWEPDNTKIYLTSYVKNRPDLYAVDTETKSMKLILDGGMFITPEVSPDGKLLAFSESFEGDPEICILNLENGEKRRITFSPGVDSNPTFAPNSREIAFTSDRTGQPQVYIMGVDGSNVRRLTFKGVYNTSPDWSPRGDWVAYHSRREGVFDIWLIHPDGSDDHPITLEAGHNEDPSWARDGRHLAFISTRNGGKGLYVMDLTGRSVRPLLVHRGTVKNPAWSR